MTVETIVESIEALLVFWFQNGYFLIMILMAINAWWIIAVLYSPESPKFLYASRRWDELHKALNYIAKFNGVEEWNGKFDEEVNSDIYNEEQLGLFDVLKISSFRVNMLIMALNWSCWSFWFYIIGYSMNKLKGNVYANGLIFGVADLFGWLISVFLMVNLSFK